LLESAPSQSERAAAWEALDLGLRERATRGEASDELLEALRRDAQSHPDDPTLTRLLARLGDATALDRLRARTRDQRLPTEARAAAVAAFAELAPPGSGGEFLALVTPTGPDPIRIAALAGWARVGTDTEAAKLVAAYPHLSPAVQARARSVLLSRRGWAAVLLRAVDAGRVSSKDFAPDELFAIAGHHDKSLDALVHKHWGTVRGATPEEKLADVRRLNNDLRAGSGDPKIGKALFFKHCAACHKLNGEGGSVGPDLTHANRADRDYLLVSLVDPSAVIRKEYLSYTAETTDGRLITGVVTAQTAASVTLTNAKAEATTLRRDEIASLRESPVSLMPEGLLTPLKPQELRDLFAYLQSPPRKP
jgi:putative heme-binding domain-containing protein